jgi:hypothetical protein
MHIHGGYDAMDSEVTPMASISLLLAYLREDVIKTLSVNAVSGVARPVRIIAEPVHAVTGFALHVTGVVRALGLGVERVTVNPYPVLSWVGIGVAIVTFWPRV